MDVSKQKVFASCLCMIQCTDDMLAKLEAVFL